MIGNIRLTCKRFSAFVYDFYPFRCLDMFAACVAYACALYVDAYSALRDQGFNLLKYFTIQSLALTLQFNKIIAQKLDKQRNKLYLCNVNKRG